MTAHLSTEALMLAPRALGWHTGARVACRIGARACVMQRSKNLGTLEATLGARETVLIRCIHAARDGDRNGVLELYDAVGALLLAVATRITRDAEAGRDVVQEVLLRVWDEAASFDANKGSAFAWLVTLTRNRAIDLHRKHKRKAEVHSQLAQEFPQTVASPEHAFAEQQNRQRVLKALHQLPSEQRVALECMYYRGLSQSEVALELNLPLGTVKTRVLLAMKKLREALHDEPARENIGLPLDGKVGEA